MADCPEVVFQSQQAYLSSLSMIYAMTMVFCCCGGSASKSDVRLQGLDNETDCLGYITYTSWVWGSAHPQAFTPENIWPDT